MDFAPLLGSVSFLAGWPDSAGRPHFSVTRPQCGRPTDQNDF